MEKSDHIELKVGVFITLGLIVLMVSILLLGGDRYVFKSYYTVYTEFSEVQGLFPGSVVSLSGIPVGNVKEISFTDNSNKLKLALQIDTQFMKRLTQGSKADIRTQGALGDKYIYIEAGPLAGEPIADNGLIPAAGSADVFEMLTNKEDGVGRVLELIKELHILIATLNADGRTASIVDNLVASTEQFKNLTGRLDLLITDIRDEIPKNKRLQQSIESFANILQKIEQGKGTIGALINDPTIHQSLKSILGNSPRNHYMKSVIRGTIEKADRAD